MTMCSGVFCVLLPFFDIPKLCVKKLKGLLAENFLISEGNLNTILMRETEIFSQDILSHFRLLLCAVTNMHFPSMNSS